VQFIHESVNDFLLRLQRLAKFDATLESDPVGSSHDRLRSCCMSYIMMEALPLPTDRRQAERLGSTYPFLNYASTYVLDHTEEAEAGNIRQAAFLEGLRDEHRTFERLRLFHSVFEGVSSRCIRDANLLYISSYHGHNKVVKILLEKGADVDAKGGCLGTALQAAASNGEEEIVAILLEKGADVNAQGGSFGTALQVAISEGEEKIVVMLLEKGADVNAQGGPLGTALQVAVYRGKEEIVAMRLENGADVNAQEVPLGFELQDAASEGEREKIVATLPEKGLNVNAQGGLFGTTQDTVVIVLLVAVLGIVWSITFWV
jgi:hypothetical protein